MPQSADRKPERYVGLDGKSKIRMVPVDREIVKKEVKKYTPPSQADIDADKKKDRKATGIKRPSMTPGSLKRRQYSGMMGKLKRESVNEISRSMTPMSKRFGKPIDPKKFDTYKKHVKKHDVDEPTVRFIDDNPNHMQAKRAMKDKHVAQAVKLYKASHKESTNEAVKHTHAAVDKKGLAIGFASHERDAKDMARRNNGKVVKLKKPMSDKKTDMMINRPFKEYHHDQPTQPAQKKKPVAEISVGKMMKYGKAAAKDIEKNRNTVKTALDQPASPKRAKAGMAAMKNLHKRSRGSDMYVNKLTGRSKVKPVAELSMSMKNLTKTGLNKAASPDKDKLKKDLKNLKTKLGEKLKVSDGMGSWIKDFQGSDAPQFKGKDKEERRDMAIAAYLSAKKGN